MKIKRMFLVILFILMVSFIAGSVSAQSVYSSANYRPRPSFESVYGPEDRLTTYWPILGKRETCEARQDLLVQVSPVGCQPAVVRSDLLAEQNVPVFCQIDALHINPLVDVQQIRGIRFVGKYPNEVISAGFHPARAALRSRDRLLGSPLINNIGYVVVILKRNEVERSLPDFVSVNLTAQIDYEADNAFGVGKAEFILEPISDVEWEQEKFRSSFWKGRYFARLESADSNTALISLYSGNRKIATTKVKKGEVSRTVWVPGAYCRAGVEVAYDGFVAAQDKATIEIGDGEAIERFDVYEGSRFLDDNCRVSDINVVEKDVGKIEISCSRGGRVVLSLGNRTFSFSVDDEVDVNGISGIIKEKLVNGSYRVEINGEIKEAKLSDMRPVVGRNVFIDRKFGDVNLERKFNESIFAFERVADEYPAERGVNSERAETYSEKALVRAIQLAGLAGKQETKARLMRKFIELYSNSQSADNYRYELNRLNLIDVADSVGVVNINERFWNVQVVSFEKPREKSNAEFSVSSVKAENVKVELDNLKNVTFGSVGTLESIRLDNIINEEEVRISVNCRVKERNEGGKTIYDISGSTHNLKRDSDATKVCDKSFVKLKDVDLKEIAKVRLLPRAQGTRTETNLTVNIGIEKRAIKLSTDKTVEMIENLNKSIKKWESISNSLGKVVTGLKGACFATSAVLIAKNFLTGLTGKSLAREKVMPRWTETCNNLVNQGRYSTINECYLEKADDINKDVSESQKYLNQVNERIKAVEKNYPTEGGFLGIGGGVDRAKAAVKYCEELKSNYASENVKLKDGSVKTVSEILGNCDEGYNNKGLYGYNELREMEYNILAKKGDVSSDVKKSAESSLESSFNRITENNERFNEVERVKKLRDKGIPSPIVATSQIRKNVVGEVVNVNNLRDVKLEGSKGTHLSSINVYDSFENPGVTGIEQGFAGGNYLLGIVKDGESYNVVEVYKENRDGTYTKMEEPDKFTRIYGIGRITPADSVSYMNPYKNPEVRFYETEPYKGMPAIVPFDVRDGWYAATRQTLPVFGGRGAFESSGRVASFYLCNVGPNGLEQFFEGYGDDICQLINLNTGQPLGVFPGLSETEARRRVGQAVQALTDAANQYASGKKFANINGKDYAVGKPAVNIPATQCQNFMSPRECWLLFNVCDPVICPPSRCDFGGTYPVADVVQTGIIGSTLLCLPNIREKIFVPVCLTGIQAGIDGYLSILKNHRDCLQESLDTGRTVGICDQIYSIYLCDFFWRQLAPMAKVILPKIVELAYGQGTRGGGEYLTVQSAWQNTQNSVNYFTQSYAVNSLKAFKARSIEEFGEPFCKAFVSAKAPTSFKSLIEPDSPPQFHAWFSSIKYSDATVPATSQYKVFYHIYAGKDSGIYYSVFLKNPPESSYYAIPAIVPVASGFVGRGQYISLSKDFTAPEGYQELCVRVNDQEECGFKQVSTSFAVNYLRDKYVEGQSKQADIKSERECVSGSPDLKALPLSPNIQANAEEALIPDITQRGIVRICSSQNPGSQTDPLRFAEVGYCDDIKIKCWVDKKSVDNAITDNNKGLRNATLSEIEKRQKDDLSYKGYIVSDDNAVAEIKILKEHIASLRGRISDIAAGRVTAITDNEVEETVKRLNALFEKVVLNHYKAEILYLIGDTRALLVEQTIKPGKADEARQAAQKAAPATGTGEGVASGGTSGGASVNVDYSLSESYLNDGARSIYIVEKKDGNRKDIFKITNKKVYFARGKELVASVKPMGEETYKFQLANEYKNFSSFRNALESAIGFVNEDDANAYYKILVDGSVYENNDRIVVASTGQFVPDFDT